MVNIEQARNVRLLCRTWTDPKSGQVMPLFELQEETAEEWNLAALAIFIRNYTAEHGAAPSDIAAAYAAHLEEGEQARRVLLSELAARRESGEVVR